MAGILAPGKPEVEQSKKKDPIVLDVIPMSLGIRIAGNRVDKIIKKNSTLPTETQKIYKPIKKDQSRIQIELLQGESEVATENHSLGKYVFENIPPGEPGAHEIEVLFQIDENSILKVEMRRVDGGETKSAEIKPTDH